MIMLHKIDIDKDRTRYDITNIPNEYDGFYYVN